MRPRPPRPDLHVSARQVAAFRLARHHLSTPAARRSLATVVRDMCGAQAQLMAPAQLSVCIRVEGLRAADVGRAVVAKSLVRVACMRRTLFLVPARDAAVFVRGAARRAGKDVRWALNKGVSPRALDAAIEAALECLDVPRTRAELAERVCRRLGVRPRAVEGGGWGNRRRLVAVPVGHVSYPVGDLLNLVASRGVVCYGHDQDGEATFVRADAWLPRYRDRSPEEAEDQLLRAYLRSFGPATMEDFALWSGITLAEVRRIWDRAAPSIGTVDLDGRPAHILRSDMQSLAGAPRGARRVHLVPAFDTFLLGHRDREHLAAARHRPRIWSPQGWVAPAVLVDGRVVAVWDHVRERDRLTVQVRAFEPLPNALVPRIRATARSLAAALETRELGLRVV